MLHSAGFAAILDVTRSKGEPQVPYRRSANAVRFWYALTGCTAGSVPLAGRPHRDACDESQSIAPDGAFRRPLGQGHLSEWFSQMRTQVSQLDDQIFCEAPAGCASGPLQIARIANIDRLRVLAAIGIVWFHIEGIPYRNIAYAGLPVFLLIFCSLLTSQGHTGTTTDFLARRWHRLLKPWLFWSAVYGLCRLAKGLATTDVGTLWEMVSVETLLAGTSIHLWYLPYAFLCSGIIYGLNRWTSRINHTVAFLAAAAVGMVLLAVHATGIWSHMVSPLPQWEFGLAAVPLGIAVGRCLMIAHREHRRLVLLTIALMVAIECLILQHFGFGVAALPYGIGLALVCLAYCWETRGDGLVASLTPLTFGIYLIHPLVIHVLRRVPAMNDHYVAFVLLTVCISTLMTLVLVRTPLRRFV